MPIIHLWNAHAAVDWRLFEGGRIEAMLPRWRRQVWTVAFGERHAVWQGARCGGVDDLVKYTRK